MSKDIVAANGRTLEPTKNYVQGPEFERELILCMPVLRRFAVKLCRNPDKADDLVQDTMLKALDKQHLFIPGSSLKAWLFTILRNHYYSQARKAGREVEGDEAFWKVVDAMNTVDLPLDERMDLQRAMDAMPDDRLAMVVRADVLGLSYAEMQRELGVAMGTVKSRVSRSREVLKQELGEAYGHTGLPVPRKVKALAPLTTTRTLPRMRFLPKAPKEAVVMNDDQIGVSPSPVDLESGEGVAVDQKVVLSALAQKANARRETYLVPLKVLMKERGVTGLKFNQELVDSGVAESLSLGMSFMRGTAPINPPRLKVLFDLMGMEPQEVDDWLKAYWDKEAKAKAGSLIRSDNVSPPEQGVLPPVLAEKPEVPMVDVSVESPAPTVAAPATKQVEKQVGAGEMSDVELAYLLIRRLLKGKKDTLEPERALAVFGDVIQLLTR